MKNDNDYELLEAQPATVTSIRLAIPSLDYDNHSAILTEWWNGSGVDVLLENDKEQNIGLDLDSALMLVVGLVSLGMVDLREVEANVEAIRSSKVEPQRPDVMIPPQGELRSIACKFVGRPSDLIRFDDSYNKIPELDRIKEVMEVEEIAAKIKSGEYSAELLLQHLIRHYNRLNRDKSKGHKNLPPL